MNKNFRKFLSVALASGMIVTTNMPLVHAQTDKEVSSTDFKTEMKLSQPKIKKGVDTNTEDLINIIVELNEEPLAVANYNKNAKTFNSKTHLDKITTQQNNFKDFVNKMKKEKTTYDQNIQFGATYNTVFNGMAMKIAGKDVEKLLDSGLVKTIHLNEQVQLTLPEQNEKQKSGVETYMHDSLNDLGLDKLHEEGITGKGIKVGVLDTGIDYTHPDLKDNYKGGYDCVDEDDNPMEATYDDWKESGMPETSPYTGSTYYTSHGTHVSGTVAANGQNTDSEFAVTGVAPEADLYGYRVLGPYGSGSFEDILQGIDLSVKAGMDVINLSLGASGADPLNPISIACDNAMIAGTTVVVANGNAGPGISTAGTPASSALAISVGASTTSLTTALYQVSSGGTSFDANTLSKNFYSSISNLENKDLELVDCGLGKTQDFEGKDLKGKVALISRGELAFVDKLSNAKKAGAELAIIYNNVDGNLDIYLGESSNGVNSLSITKSEGENLKARLDKGENVTINFKENGTISSQKDILADFSSRGPIPNGMSIKPDVVAPGVSIISTYPEYINHKEDGKDYKAAYGRISGTSMASPHVAGLAALVEQQNPDYTPFDTKVAIMNTSDDMAKEYGVNEIGSGRIDPENAIKSGMSIRLKDTAPTIDENGELSTINNESGSISFGRLGLEDGTATATKELTIQNKTTSNNTFDVSVEYISPSESHGGKDAVKNGVTVDVKNTVTASENQATTLDVKLTIPKNAEHGLYQGYIKLVSTVNEGEEYKVPFSVQAVQPGIGQLDIYPGSMTTDVDNIEMSDGVIGLEAIINLRSPMEKLHIVIRDGETDELVGYTGTLDATNAPTDVELYAGYFIREWGSVRPFIDGKLQNYYEELKEGYYKLELVGESSSGKHYTASHGFVVDNNPLEYSFELNGKDIPAKSQIIEMKEDLFTTRKDNQGKEHTAVWLDGVAYDSSIELLKNKGVTELPLLNSKVDQSLSIIKGYINDNWINDVFFKPDANGKFMFGVTPEDVKSLGYEKLTLEGLDLAYSRDSRVAGPQLVFVEEGRTYIEPRYNKDSVKKGEEVKLTIKLNNPEDISKVNTKLHVSKEYDVVEAKLVKKVNSQFKLNYTTKDVPAQNEWEDDYTLVDLNVDSKGKNLLNSNTDLIEVTLRLNDDTINTRDSIPMIIQEVNLSNKSNENVECLNLLNPAIIKDTKSSISGGATSEALLKAHNELLDPDKHKVDIYATDKDGNKYEAELSKSGYMSARMNYEIKNITPDNEYLDLTIDFPGHFPVSTKVLSSKILRDDIVSKRIRTMIDAMSIPGDVNSDNVIDIKDAQAIADLYNQSNTDLGEVDLNQDGTVNNKDMYFVIKNFGMENPLKPGTKPVGNKDELQKILDDVKYTDPGYDVE